MPVLWRPFPEISKWFWWGKGESGVFKKLWTTMYNYYVVDRKLNNLIWVLCYSSQPNIAWFPGDQYVDVAAANLYVKSVDAQSALFKSTKKSIDGKSTIPIAYHECSYIPDPDLCKMENSMWLWWMEWDTQYIQGIDKAYLKKVYNHDLVVTLDELPAKVDYCQLVTATDPPGGKYITSCFQNSSSGDIDIATEGEFNYIIYSIESKEIEKGVGYNTASAGKKLVNGIYIVKIESSSINKIFKITKSL